MTTQLARRDFIKLTIAASGGLLLGFSLPEWVMGEPSNGAAKESSPNAFLRIGSDERITIIVNHSEMGQGVYTSLPMLLAEELDADWTRIGFEPAPVDAVYNDPAFGMQMTGGSSSIWSSMEQYRHAGAAARVLLLTAAAKRWNAEAADCRTENGKVIHTPSGKTLSYGALAEEAAHQTPPAQVQMKDEASYKFVGQPLKRLDSAMKSNGSAVFGIDVKLPGMLTAVVARPPVFGATLAGVDAKAAEAMPGVHKVVAVPSGVAVIADSFWQAKQARDKLKTQWNEGAMQGYSSAHQREDYLALSAKPGPSARKQGDVNAALESAAKRVEAVYEFPYLSHAMMEPLNCAVDLRADHCDVWTGTQFQTIDRAAAAEVAGLKHEQVQVHTTFLGGGFGRRANPASDFVREAVHVAKAAGKPVKVIWTREDDMHGGYYRPSYVHRAIGGVDGNGQPVAWLHRVVGQSILDSTPFGRGEEIDDSSVEGLNDLSYDIPNLSVEYHKTKVGVPVLWLRSVGHTHTAFAKECFIDELAALGGQDPVELRRRLLQKHPRELGVLKTAAEKSGWGTPLPAGHARGVAVHASFRSFFAQVAEVSVDRLGRPRVHRVTCAVDCGAIVNPNIIEAQVQGAVIFGLTAAFYGELTLENGRIQQRNFHDYGMLRMHECPEIDVHIVRNHEKSGGIGEPGVPCTAPAVANAIYTATGVRVRKLPMRKIEMGESNA